MSTTCAPPRPAIDAAGLRRLLPHRFPMLLVDEVTELVSGEHLVARKAISGNEPWYARMADAREFADLAYPKTLLIESWCQSAGVLATVDRPNPDVTRGQVMLFGSISGIEFHSDVFPGEVVEHHVEVFRALPDTLLVTGTSTASGRPVLSVSRVVMTFRPAEALRPPEAE